MSNPKVFGISNSGSTCWLATLTQFLLSSDSFMDAVARGEKTDPYYNLTNIKNTPDGRGEKTDPYYNLTNIKNTPDGRGEQSNVIIKEFARLGRAREFEGIVFSGEYLRALSNHDNTSAQKSILDAFLILINRMDTQIKNLFMLRFHSIIDCKCGYNSESKYENYFAPVYTSKISEQLLKNTIQTDGKCEKCKQNYVNKTDKISRVGDNMVLIVNKQNIDLEANEIITFPGKDKTYIKYKLVARAEHSGDSNGGHYWCLCVRGGKYYILNDSQIREISKSEFLRAGNNTYMILYTKI